MSYKAGSVIIDIKADTAKLVTGMNKAEKTVARSVTNIKNTLITLTSAYAGFSGVEKILRTGFTFNKQMEDSVAGLTALTVATSSNISAMGKHLSIAEKYNLAQKEAIKTTKELQAINAQTPHTLTQTTEIYRSLYVTMKKVGATNEQMIDLTKKLSIASAAGGVQFQELLAGVDGIATGTVLANSNLGRFLSSLGLTNKALKSTKDVVKLVEDRLSQMKALDTMTVAVSNLDNNWQQLTGDMTKDIFASSKVAIKETTSLLHELDKMLTHTSKYNTEVDFLVATISRTTDMFNILEKTIVNGAENSVYGISSLVYGTLAPITHMLSVVAKGLNKIHLTSDADVLGALKLEVAMYGHAEHAQRKIKENTKEIADAIKKASPTIKERVLQYQKERREVEKRVALEKKSDALTKTRHKSFKEKLDALPSLSKNNGNADADAILKALKEKNKLNQQAYAIYTSIMSTNYEKWLQDASDKMAKLAESGAFTDKQLLNVWDTMQKDYEMKIEIKGIDKAQSQMDKMYDTQINLMQNGLDWGNSLTGVSQKIANAGKAFTQYTLANMKSEKAEADMSSKYSKDWLKIENSKITAKEKEAQQTALYGNFKKNIDKDQAVRHSAELAAVSNLAGSMASMYERGTSGAIAFTAVQSALGIASSWTAIAEAWALGFPENIAAVAMVTSNVLPIIAQLGGSGGGGGAKAPTREDVYKKKADDYKASTKPITDRLDRQIELLKAISGYGGNAIAKELTQAKATYGVQSNIDRLDTLGKLWQPKVMNPNLLVFRVSGMHTELQNKYKKYVDKDTSTFYNGIGGKLNLNTTTKSTESSLIEFLMKVNKNKDLKTFGLSKTDYKDIINQAEKTAHDFSMSIINSYKEILDAGKSFKNDYDSLFNNFYKNSQLQADKAKVDKLKGNASLGDYLKNTIADIDKIKSKLSTKNMDTLLSEDPKDLAKKVKLNKEIADAYGNSTAEAINNIKAINNVAQAMATSKNNSKAFLDSFKTQKQLAEDMAKVQGVTLATSQKGLMALYYKLANDTDGLTNADLNLLNANKALLTSTKAVAKAIQDNVHKTSQLDEIYKLTHSARSYELYQRQNVLKAMGKEDKARQIQINKLLDSTKATEASNKNIASWGKTSGADNKTLQELADSVSYAYTITQRHTHRFWGHTWSFLTDTLKTAHPEVARTTEELQKLFTKLKGGVGGLTDAELQFLTANKAMIDTSKNNSKSFLDSFKTQKQLAEDMAKVQGVTLATSQKGLMALYYKLANDTDGLTNADLNLLNANKALLTSTKAVAKAIQDNVHKTSQLDEIYKLTHSARSYELYQRRNVLKAMGKEDRARQIQINKLLDSTKAENKRTQAIKEYQDKIQTTFDNVLNGWMTSLKSSMTQISDTANSLRASSVKGSALAQYYASMATTKKDINSGSYNDFSKSLSKTIQYSSALRDSNNFSNEKDMQFAQLVGANQFDSLNVDVNREYNTLKEIAKSNSKLYKAQEEQNKLIEAQANEIKAMRKEIQDQSDYLIGIEEKIA